MRRFVLLCCVMLAVVLSANATLWQVTVQDFEFVPATLTISRGDTVVWTNVQGAHNVFNACNPSLFGNVVAEAPWVYQFVFDIPPGHYHYLCEVHPDIMLGTVIVQRVPQRTNVTVQNFSFTPANIAVQQGDSVVWTNILGTHNVHHTGNPSLFGRAVANAPWTYPFVFNLPAGSYSYNCEVHFMQGTVTVSAPPPPPAAPDDLVIHVSNENALLNWSAVSGASCYAIYRSQVSEQSPFTQLIGVTGETMFFQSITALPGTKYFFQVRAIAN